MLSEQRFFLPASYRLRKRADFQRVYSEGVRVSGRHLVVFLMRSDGHHGRLGVTASRRVGGAVVRSRCKRRLRELYRTHRPELATTALDVVLNARGSTASASWADLEKDYLACMRCGLARVQRRTMANPERVPGQTTAEKTTL
ncbi:MAG: ribonuclease P protein component [Acidobacteriota bacterium]